MNCVIKLSLPEDVKLIIDTITKAGYEAYAVGGCIRDMLLDRVPDDFDITTSATPAIVKSLFRRTVDTGIEHGTVTVLIKDTGYEVTTYRIDGEYEDHRHPSSVSFTSSLTEDLRRRDFTINAMAYNDEQGLVDPFDGREDIERKLIRCVGIPEERFSEDALRILRAIRFSAQLGYSIDEATASAMKKLCGNLKSVSAERIRVELTKTLVSQNPERLVWAYELGITSVILPEFDRMMETPQNNPHHLYCVGLHAIKAIEYIRNDRILRLTMLLHDIGKPYSQKTDDEGIDHFHGHPVKSEEMARVILNRLKFDNNTIHMVCELTRLHDIKIETNLRSVRRAISRMGKEVFRLLLEVKRADIMAQSDFQREEKLQRLSEIENLYDEIIKRGECTEIKELLIDGRDLINIGYKPGPNLGRELAKLLDQVLEEPALNNADTLLELARKDME